MRRWPGADCACSVTFCACCVPTCQDRTCPEGKECVPFGAQGSICAEAHGQNGHRTPCPDDRFCSPEAISHQADGSGCRARHYAVARRLGMRADTNRPARAAVGRRGLAGGIPRTVVPGRADALTEVVVLVGIGLVAAHPPLVEPDPATGPVRQDRALRTRRASGRTGAPGKARRAPLHRNSSPGPRTCNDFRGK